MPLRRVESPAERLKDPEYSMEYGEETARASLAVCLATARIEAGLTQQQLATMIGRSQPYVSKLESGEANPTLGAIGRILACLGKQLVCEAQPLVGTRDEIPVSLPNPRRR
jgi:transcriptional regulator with XRE-family HTH domain